MADEEITKSIISLKIVLLCSCVDKSFPLSFMIIFSAGLSYIVSKASIKKERFEDKMTIVEIIVEIFNCLSLL